MELKEYTSKHLNVPFVYLKDREKYLCSNGVLFTKKEYLDGIDLRKEFEERERAGQLYDYAYAKSTGLLRKKRAVQVPAVNVDIMKKEAGNVEKVSKVKEVSKVKVADTEESNTGFSIKIICILLAFTSVISMYISTLHTATYLKDYVDLFSAWLMSASVTAYNGTAFEVSVIFHSRRRNLTSLVFMSLWVFVTLFSMATTVSVFYDQYNFNEAVLVSENRSLDSSRLQLELLQRKEADLREAISFKKKDIEYRQERDYATTAVRKELSGLEDELQANLEEQKSVVSAVPEAVKGTEEVQRKESLFAFLGRMLRIEGGVLEFVMSTLSAIFVNLIAPLSLTAVIELLYKKEDVDKLK